MADEGGSRGKGTSDKADKSTVKRLATATAVVVLVAVVPAGVGYFLSGEGAAVGGLVGSLVAFLMGTAAGTRRVWQFLPGLLLAAGISPLLAGSWWWVAAVGLIGAAAGIAARYGLFIPMVLIGVMFSIFPGSDSVREIVVGVVFCAVGAVNGWALARVVGTPSVVEFEPLSPNRAAKAAIALGLAAGVAAVVMQVWGNDYGYWLPMTVFVLAIPRPGIGIPRAAVHRTAGTAVGALLAGAVALTDPPTGLPLALGAVVLIVAFVVQEPPWLSAALSAAALVMLLTPPGGGLVVADSRVLATAGGALIIGGLAVLGSWWARGHAPTPEEAEMRQTMDRLTGREQDGEGEGGHEGGNDEAVSR